VVFEERRAKHVAIVLFFLSPPLLSRRPAPLLALFYFSKHQYIYILATNPLYLHTKYNNAVN
jgi:hypothetical protein